uniref:Photosystem II reaction center protein Z n=1 Tax=Prasinococcus sp. CCMP1194 TaxID=110672 RepID=A0A088CJX7_9VIRI|nr:Z protein of photosystem II [Prasinococcus sp. CCMP1194]
MLFLFQLAVFGLIGVSFLLVIGVPVVLASPSNSGTLKQTVVSGLGVWLLLVFLVGILNSFVV